MAHFICAVCAFAALFVPFEQAHLGFVLCLSGLCRLYYSYIIVDNLLDGQIPAHLRVIQGPIDTSKIRDKRVIRDTHVNTCLAETGPGQTETGPERSGPVPVLRQSNGPGPRPVLATDSAVWD